MGSISLVDVADGAAQQSKQFTGEFALLGCVFRVVGAMNQVLQMLPVGRRIFDEIFRQGIRLGEQAFAPAFELVKLVSSGGGFARQTIDLVLDGGDVAIAH